MRILWLKVIRDVVIISLLTSAGGLVVNISGIQASQNRLFLAAANILFGSLGFIISGCLAKVDRFRHLFAVAIGLWVASLSNTLLGAPFIHWFLGLIPILIMMATGGALSLLFVRAPRPAQDVAKNDEAGLT